MFTFKVINNFQGVIFLLAITLGEVYNYIPFAFSLNLWITISFLFFNYLSVLISSSLLIWTSEVNKLGSLQELLCFLDGGRAGILYLSTLFVIYFSMVPVAAIFVFTDYSCQLFNISANQNGYKILIIIIFGILSYPFCLIKKLQQMRKVAYIVALINILQLLVLIIIALWKPVNIEQSKSEKYDYGFLPLFNIVYQFQIYLLAIYQCLPLRKRAFNGLIISFSASTISFFYYILFSIAFGLAFNWLQNSNQLVSAISQLKGLGYFFDIIVLLQKFFDFQFQFFIGKEFVFILFDELKNKNMSKKVEDLQDLSFQKKVYSQLMVIKVRKDLYEVVRMPYLKLKYSIYVLITTIYLVINILIAISLRHQIPQQNNTQKFNFFLELLFFLACFIQPFLIYVLPGFLFYKTCERYMIYKIRKYFALAFSALGILLMVIYVTIELYYQLDQ